MKRLIVCLCLLIPAITYCQIIHVPGTYPTIQQGIDAAEESDTILVDVGTYHENIVISGKRIVVGSKFLITGDTSYISQTIINGTQQGSVVTFGPEEILDTQFSGFTITNGSGNTGGMGGGILLTAARPILTNLVISSNSANRGGGISNVNSSTLNLSHSRIINNSASLKGGGIYSHISNLFVNDCEFIQNNATSQGGGAIIFEVSENYDHTLHVQIRSSSFIQNICSQNASGGVSIKQTGEANEIVVKISGCTFEENLSKGNNSLLISGAQARVDIQNCSFTNNEAEQYCAGAAFLQNAHGRVVGSLFANNRAATGGGDWNSGGATVWGGAQIDFINCAFIENEASYGAGLTVGGGGTANLGNCIFWGNTNDQIALVDFNDIGGNIDIGFSNIQYGIDSISVTPNSYLFWGEENMDVDPLFVGEGDHPYSLDKHSPCIDAGTPDTNSLNLPQYDLIGNWRVWDGDSNGVAIIDMGPYEYGPSLLGIDPTEIDKPTLSCLTVYPNPFSSSTTIEYKLAHPAKVIIIFYNQLGRQVEIIEAYQLKGLQKMVWAPANLSDGIYFYRFKAGEQMASGKLVLKR